MPKVRDRNHGLSKGSEYRTWSAMHTRCYNPKSKAFADYGGRGIVICDRWRNSFIDFLADMGMRPSPRHSIDRINNDGNYEPLNCRWATKEQQDANRRNNHRLTHDGRTMTITEWASFLGRPFRLIQSRIANGWTVEKALTHPQIDNHEPRHTTTRFEYDGKSHTLTEWAAITGLAREAIRGRLRSGWSIEDALTKPVLYEHPLRRRG